MKKILPLIIIALTFLCSLGTNAQTTFTSVANGNWNDGATWGNTSPGVQGTDWPATTDNVVVATGHTVTLTGGTTIVDLDIQTGGTLDALGFTMTVDGNLIVNGDYTTNSSAQDLLVSAPTSGTVDGSGTISINNTSSGLSLFGTISILSTADLTINGQIIVTAVFVNTTVTNNGIIRASGDVNGFAFSGTPSWINSTGSQLVVGGQLMNTGNLTATASNNTVEYNSSSNINLNPVTYHNLTLSGTATYTITTSTIINGNLNITAGTLNANTNNLNIAGDFTIAGTFTESTGTVTLDGTADQNLSITSDGSFNNLTINKASGNVIVDNNIDVSGTLELSGGNVDMSGNTLTLGTGTGATGTLTATSGRIIGSFTRWIAATGTYEFPIGVSANDRTVDLNINTLTTGGTVTASFLTASPGAAGIPFMDGATEITSTFPDGYWDLSAANSFAMSNYDLDLTGDGFSSVPGVDMDTRLLIRADAGSNWGVEGTHVNASGTVVQRDAMTSFPSQFSFGDDAVCTPPETSVITGNNIVCTSASFELYSVTLNSGNNYTWTVEGGTITSASSGLNLNSIAVDWSSTGQIGSVNVIEDNGICTGIESSLAVTIDPIAPTAIVGETTVFEGDTESYSVTGIAGYTYQWSVTNGTITSANGGTSITVDWDDIASDATLDITGVVSVVAQATGCTDAAPFAINVTVQNTIRAIANDLWSVGTTWSTGSAPTQDDNVIVADGFDVTVIGTQEVNDLTIAAGSSVSSNDNFIINGDLVVDGTLSVTGTSRDLQFVGTRTGPFNNISGTGTISVMDGNLEITDENKDILAGSNLSIASGNIEIAAGLTVSNAGTISVTEDIVGLATSSTLTNEANSSLTIDGIFLSTGTLNASAADNTIVLNRTGTYDLIEPTSNTFHHLTLAGGGTKNYNSTLIINGDLNLQAGSFDVPGSNVDIELGGNWNNTGATFNQRQGDVEFLGTGDQLIINTSGEETFHNIVINKASGVVTIQDGTSVRISQQLVPGGAGSVTFTSGILNTTATAQLVFEPGATTTGANATSFVDGPVIKIGTDNFQFPLGDGAIWAPLMISDVQNGDTDDEVMVEYFDSTPANTTSLGVGLNNVSIVEFWDVNVDLGVGDTDPFSIDMQFFWKNAARSSITDATELRIAHFTAGQWEEIVQSSSTAGTAGDVTINNISSFSPFTFASSTDTENPLPVELVSFEVSMQDNQAMLDWTTASELNNDFFEIQRSEDGTNWNIIGEVDGNGTINELIDYQYIDENPLFGESFYRLKQVDFDGQFEFSPIVSLSNPFTGKSIQAYVYPNPTSSSDINLKLLTGNRENKINIDLIDAIGHSYFSQKLDAGEFNGNLVIRPTTNLAKGIYFMVVRQNNQVIKQRIIIN